MLPSDLTPPGPEQPPTGDDPEVPPLPEAASGEADAGTALGERDGASPMQIAAGEPAVDGTEEDAAPDWFDAAWYQTHYDDVKASGVDPYTHYRLHGRNENRSPSAAAMPLVRDPAVPVWFDADWYLATYPDVQAAGIDPFQHFVTAGRDEGRRPNLQARWPRWFDGGWYSVFYADAAASGQDAFTHYRETGRAKNYAANALLRRLGVPVRPPIDMADRDRARMQALLEQCGLFDADWYATRYGVLRDNAIHHYVTAGAFLGADPNPAFSSFDYFVANPDVAAIGYNPLRHYIEFGFAEGRRVSRAKQSQGRITARVWRRGF